MSEKPNAVFFIQYKAVLHFSTLMVYGPEIGHLWGQQRERLYWRKVLNPFRRCKRVAKSLLSWTYNIAYRIPLTSNMAEKRINPSLRRAAITSVQYLYYLEFRAWRFYLQRVSTNRRITARSILVAYPVNKLVIVKHCLYLEVTVWNYSKKEVARLNISSYILIESSAAGTAFLTM